MTKTIKIGKDLVTQPARAAALQATSQTFNFYQIGSARVAVPPRFDVMDHR